MLTRGFGKYKAEAAGSLDAAALMMQLALRLLERSEPGGPSRITGPVEVDLLDEINHINLDTGSAEGGFRAPWSIAGSFQRRVKHSADSTCASHSRQALRVKSSKPACGFTDWPNMQKQISRCRDPA